VYATMTLVTPSSYSVPHNAPNPTPGTPPCQVGHAMNDHYIREIYPLLELQERGGASSTLPVNCTSAEPYWLVILIAAEITLTTPSPNSTPRDLPPLPDVPVKDVEAPGGSLHHFWAN